MIPITTTIYYCCFVIRAGTFYKEGIAATTCILYLISPFLVKDGPLIHIHHQARLLSLCAGKCRVEADNNCKSGITLHCTSRSFAMVLCSLASRPPLCTFISKRLFSTSCPVASLDYYLTKPQGGGVCAPLVPLNVTTTLLSHTLFTTTEHLLRLNLNKSKQLLGEQ